MLALDLKCGDCRQEFEGWFKGHRDFVCQKESQVLRCPTCDSQNVEKKLSVPFIGKKANQRGAHRKGPKDLAPEQVRKIIQDYRQYVHKNFENVGDSFADEARKIHYGEAEYRNIYGRIQKDEARELMDEGVEVLPLPDEPVCH